MIVNWFLMLMQASVDLIMGLVPDWSVPAGLLNLDDQVSSLLNSVAGLGVWVNWGLCIGLCFVPLALWAAGLGFKIALFVWAKVPVLGGK